MDFYAPRYRVNNARFPITAIDPLTQEKKLFQLQIRWVHDQVVAVVLFDETNTEKCYYHDELISNRDLFYFQLSESGKKERIEFRHNGDQLSGDIRVNITPYYFDDWELKYLFREL
jgi:hypothetical protein